MTGAILEVVGFLQLKNKILFYQLTKIKNKPSHDEFLKKNLHDLQTFAGSGVGGEQDTTHLFPFRITSYQFKNNTMDSV